MKKLKNHNDTGNQNKSLSIWLVTFCDLIMLLLTFFVMLLSMKTLNISESKTTFKGFIATQKNLSYIDHNQKKHPAKIIFSKTILKQKLIAQSIDLNNIIKIDEDKRGVIINIGSQHLFDSGKVELRKEAYNILDKIAMILENIDNDILIMGHTDNRPVSIKKIKDNWDLSFARSLSVYSYLIEQAGLMYDNIGVGGYGSTKPLLPNTTQENMAKNRRVEFILKR